MNAERQIELSEDVHVEVIDPTLASPLEHAKAIGKQFTLDERDESFVVVDLSAVLAQLRRWRSRLARVEPFYAVKCNDDAGVLRTLARAGAGFDCASQAELRRVLQLGVSPDRIVYANPCKHASMIRFARSSQVDLMTFDNLDELHKIKQHYPDAKMVLRVLPQGSKARCVLGNKFGAPYDTVAELIDTAKALGVEIVGVSFHVGSQCQEAESYALAMRLARRVFDDLTVAGFQPYLVDIGGGFPGVDDDVVSFEEIADVVNTCLDSYFPASGGYRVIGEPGRYMVTRAFTLMTAVIGKRAVAYTEGEKEATDGGKASESSSESSHMLYYLNDGVYGSLSCVMFDHVDLKPQAAKPVPDGAVRHRSSLYGPTCDGLDLVAKDILLPDLSVGDWLYFELMGAYTLVSASDFNGMPHAARFYVLNKSDVALFQQELAATVSRRSTDLLDVLDPTMLHDTSDLTRAKEPQTALLGNGNQSAEAEAVEQLEKFLNEAHAASKTNDSCGESDSFSEEPAVTLVFDL